MTTEESPGPGAAELKSAEPLITRKEGSPSLLRNKWGLTEREEAFCHLYVQSGDAEKSYLQAGYARPKKQYADIKANELLKKDKITDRVTALAMAKGKRRQVSKDVYLEMLLKNHEEAQLNGDYNAANKALEIFGKSTGFLIEQKQTVALTASMNKPLAEGSQSERLQMLAEMAGIQLKLPQPRAIEADFEEVEGE